MSSFKPMVKMYTDEPSVSLKLKKGGKVKAKHHKEHEEHGHKAMHHAAHGMMHGAHHAFEAEHGKAPKKPSMSERRKAMNPNMYAKGGKVAHKVMGGGMPMGNAVGMGTMRPMAPTTLNAMSPQERAARAMQVKKALTGMKKGGSADHALIKKLEKELHHHESMPMEKAHKMHHKASGGAIDKAETRTTIEGNAKKFANTKMDTSHKDRAHGTGEIHEDKPGGYKHGGHAHKKHHKATGGAIPAETHESKNKAKTKFGGTYEGNEHDYVNTEMHTAKNDKAHGTGGVAMSNAGGFKHGGKAHHKMHHKASGGMIDKAETRTTVEGGNWENRRADTATKGKTHTKTGEVHESNAGGYKHGGHATKKAYATGGNVVDDGKATKMPKHFVSRPVANSLQSGTFAKGGKVNFYSDLAKKLEKNPEKPNLRLVKTHTGPKGHVAKVYKDRDYGEYRTKFYTPEGKHLTEGDSHTDDAEDAHMTAMHEVNKGYKHGGRAKKKFDIGGSTDDQAFADKASRDYSNWEKSQREENEADKNMIPNAIKRAVSGVKSLFGSSSAPDGSVTKTEKSVTVSPAKKRGGSMRKC